jgi:hypothetical protein
VDIIRVVASFQVVGPGLFYASDWNLNLDDDWVINVMAAAAMRSMKGIAALQQ